MSTQFPTARLPAEVQALLKHRLGRHLPKTVFVRTKEWPLHLTPLPPSEEHWKRREKYAVSPSAEWSANRSYFTGEWPHYTVVEAATTPLPHPGGPWSIVEWTTMVGKVLLINVTHLPNDTRYATQRSQLTGLAAAYLYMLGRTRGEYRKRSERAFLSYLALLGNTPGTLSVLEDELLERGLIKQTAAGSRLTDEGKATAQRIPDSYDPDHWVYMPGAGRLDERTHAPRAGLFGLTPRTDIAFNVITGRRSNPPNVVVSTVKLPDYGDGDAPFETMVFPSSEKGDLLDLKALDSARTDDETEALRQHRRMVQKWAVGTSFNGLADTEYPATEERVRYGR